MRDRATSAKKKSATYSWYDIKRPTKNSRKTQICELDHPVSLELARGGHARQLWPQCGPSRVQLRARYFKQKDVVENWLANKVRSGRVSIAAAQNGIARDWTQYLQAAKAACKACKRQKDN